MRRITFLINSMSLGGAEKVLSVILEKLLEEGYRIEVILLERTNFYLCKANKIYLSNFIGNKNRIRKLLYLPLLAWKLKKYVEKHNIKLIQSHIHRANYVNILAKLLGGKHKAQIVVNGVISRYLKEGLKGKVNLFLLKFLYPKADLIIWKSRAMQMDANRLFKFKNEQVVINNPCDIGKIQKLASEEVDFNFEKDKIYLVSVGRLVRIKRNRDLIRALVNLPKNVEVLFIGDGKEKDNLIKYAKDLGIYDRVHFLGRVKNPFKYLKYCNIFVHTSETEGFPNALVEAMACKLPVISSDCISGPREILAPDTDINRQLKKGDDIELAKYGILFPVGDIKRLVEAIKLLINSEKLREKYFKLGFERAKNFSIERIVQKYKEVLLK